MDKRLENFKPRLRSGRMIPHGATFTFELDETKEQITLPMFLADFVLLCGGKFTIREIVEKIYRKQGSVPFRTILETLYTLHSRSFLENSEELAEKPWLTKQQLIKRKLFYDFRSTAMILGPGPQPVVFYLMSLAVLAFSCLGVALDWQNPIEAGEQFAMLEPMFFAQLFCVNCLLLSGKYLIRSAQVLFLTGRVTDFCIRVSPWGIYLRTEDPQMENLNTFFPVLFYVSQIVVPFGILQVLLFVFGQKYDWLFVSTCYMVFWELNPFRKTDFYKALRSLVMPHRLDSFAFVDTGINPRHQKFIAACSVFGLAWLSGGVRILESTGLGFGGSIASAFSQGPVGDKLMAAVWTVVWLSGLFFMVHSFVETTSAIGTEQLVYWHLRFSRKLKIPASLAQHTEKRLVEILRNLPLFAHLADDGLQRLVSGSQLFRADAGTPILIAGEQSHHLFVLLEGSVAIEKGELSSPILPTTIFGESALIEGGTRSATVVAREDSLCLKISISQLREIARESHVIGELEHFMTAIMVDQFFASSPLFRKLSREGIDFLSARGKLEFVGGGETIFSQGDPGDYFYMVIRGSVRAEVNADNVKTIPQGGFFGEISLIANIPRTATVVAEEPCVLFKISMDAFWEVLVQHIEMALFIESVGEQRLIEDMQVMNRTG